MIAYQLAGLGADALVSQTTPDTYITTDKFGNTLSCPTAGGACKIIGYAIPPPPPAPSTQTTTVAPPPPPPAGSTGQFLEVLPAPAPTPTCPTCTWSKAHCQRVYPCPTCPPAADCPACPPPPAQPSWFKILATGAGVVAAAALGAWMASRS